MGVYREPFLLQGEMISLLQSFLTGWVLEPFDHLCGLPLDFLQSVHIFLELWDQNWTEPTRYGLTSTD